ncbi:golgi membrane protein [Mytilinidion resinicola]|uniref:Protein CASP n=1 Tax=Mytilinidion resinicola TaxID=574789 RepID=A0A6A6Z6Y4_9PEZI|nr:golgi membrane protein [Mytilinidion resinicola]KAF2816064.1 golgi membrane protein [Mytilinidion resinicola]
MDLAADEPRSSQESNPIDKLDDLAEFAGNGGDNKFQTAIAAWRNIDLTTLIPTLDTAASDIVAHQRDTLTQRKDLAQKTKDFRKLDDASKLSDIKGLLKSYQTFIDLISNQSKAVQAAFFQVYSPLSEAPDPYPLLEASIDSLVTAEETVPKLTAENEHLQRTVSNLTTQLEETESKLEQERSARQSLEESRDSKIKEVGSSWEAVLAEKQDNWEAKEKSLEEKVENQDRLLKELKASYEVSQRLGRGEEGESEASLGGATAAELEIVSSELERTSIRLAEVEARNEQLRLELAQSASSTQSSQQQVVIEDEPAFLRLRSENSSLLRKLESAKFEKDSEKRRLETESRSLEREIASLKGERENLREKVQKWADYENVKQELEVLKSIEFSTGDEDDGNIPSEEATHHQNGTLSKSKGETLEQLLLARNKKLNNELTVLRVSHQDLQSRLESLQEELSSTNMELEKSRRLTETLENDLEKVQQEASNAFPSSAMSVAGTYASRYPQSSFGGRRKQSSPTSSIISGFDPQQASLNTMEAIRMGEPVGGGSGILPMVTAQRDRFKKRNSELESELSKAYQNVSSLRSEIASLQKDNLDLYEKTRYVSTYNRGHPAGSSALQYSTNPNPSTIQVSSDTSSGLTMDRYRSTYEQNISPFAAFRGRESARALKRMSVFERIVFRITRLVLATRTSRNLFAAYCLGLHLLVFFMLYWAGTADIEKHSANLGEAALAAAAGGGPVDGGGEANPGDWHQEGFQEGG